MATKFGYLLPTRELVMGGKPAATPVLDLAKRAADLGYKSVWVGDSLLAKPRHEPLTLLAAIAAQTTELEIGTAVLLPALRNPVVLAHLIATVDQISAGRLILGVGIAADVPTIRSEFEAAGVPWEKRADRMMEGLRLCKALWSGQKVDWDGRWKVRGHSLDMTPYQSGGPPLWGGGSAQGSLQRAGKELDGWMPIGPNAATIGQDWSKIKQIAEDASRDPNQLTCSAYLTLALDDNRETANTRLNTYLENYYGGPAENFRKMSACYAGPASEAQEWLMQFKENGVKHIILRFAGDQETHLKNFASLGSTLN